MLVDKNKKLILLALNEINFSIVEKYLAAGIKLSNFSKILHLKSINTLAEKKYEELEPWIQWHSIHTGLSFSDHQIFRLGDGVNCDKKNIYNILEDYGLSVGAVSPMNLKNNLNNPKYFIPDPWTRTLPDFNWWSKKFSEALVQIVNDNAKSKINLTNVFVIIASIFRFSKPINYFLYLKLLVLSLLGKKWKKAMILDLLLNDIHISLYKKHNPNFSSIFLNGGAHIQHHFFFNSKFYSLEKNPSWYVNSKDDPVLDMLIIYDKILGIILNEKTPFIIATGLSQDFNGQREFYYRLKNHSAFLKKINLEFLKIDTRMSRDFEIHFANNYHRDEAKKTLQNIYVDQNKLKLFGEIESRNKSLFVTLTYPEEINSQTKVLVNNETIDLYKHVVFVAIKNGKHQSKGFAYFSNEISDYMPADNVHVKNIFHSIKKYFEAV